MLPAAKLPIARMIPARISKAASNLFMVPRMLISKRLNPLGMIAPLLVFAGAASQEAGSGSIDRNPPESALAQRCRPTYALPRKGPPGGHHGRKRNDFA